MFIWLEMHGFKIALNNTQRKRRLINMKSVNQTTGKGVLDINWSEGVATITEITKDGEIPYNFFEILEMYNGKQVNFSIREENPVEPIEDN